MDQMNQTNTPYDDFNELQEINYLLMKVGRLADSLNSKGYTVKMWLWGEPGESFRGRLQGNVCKAFLYK